jgi:hypothetical protein
MSKEDWIVIIVVVLVAVCSICVTPYMPLF